MFLSQRFFFIWMYCIVLPVSGISVREISKKMGGVQYKTCYYMTRKAMQKITDSEKGKMLWVIMRWMNCICSGLKGKNYHNIIISSERLSRRRALKPPPPPGRDRFDRDFQMILCYHQRGGDTIFAVPQKYPSIASLVCMIISKVIV